MGFRPTKRVRAKDDFSKTIEVSQNPFFFRHNIPRGAHDTLRTAPELPGKCPKSGTQIVTFSDPIWSYTPREIVNFSKTIEVSQNPFIFGTTSPEVHTMRNGQLQSSPGNARRVVHKL